MQKEHTVEWYNRSREEGHFFHIFFLPILSSCSRSGRQKSVKALAKCGQRKASCNREREIHNKSICNQRIESLKIHFYRKGLSFRTHRRLLAIYIHFQSAGGPLLGRFLGPRKKPSLQKSILLEVFLQYKYVNRGFQNSKVPLFS